MDSIGDESLEFIKVYIALKEIQVPGKIEKITKYLFIDCGG